MKELKVNELDPLDFTLWDSIGDTAKKRRKSNCNWNLS